jgi:hypothetical protein
MNDLRTREFSFDEIDRIVNARSLLRAVRVLSIVNR